MIFQLFLRITVAEKDERGVNDASNDFKDHRF